MQSVVPLEALDGISYVVSRDGTIGAIGAIKWNDFACQNGGPELLDKCIIGRNLFDFVSGADVRSHIRHILYELSTRRRPACALPLRCDAPAQLRNLRQSITPIFEANECHSFLFQCVELHSRQRPSIDLYDFKVRAKQDLSLPLIVMCSWCLRIQSAASTTDRWITAENYYAAGGRSEVRISHGICEACVEVAFPSSVQKKGRPEQL
jgi:hypothetical protein